MAFYSPRGSDGVSLAGKAKHLWLRPQDRVSHSEMKSLTLISSLICLLCLTPLGLSQANTLRPCPKELSSKDSVVLAKEDGQILYQQNEKMKRVPASTLKLLTALVAIHNLGPFFRFQTSFYLDDTQNLIVKGYGDPLLISEAWQNIAALLAQKVHSFHDLVVDDTYFSHQIEIPGRHLSTNPYDAPVGALCANFNTVFFERDASGRIISAEPQTPMIPFALKKIRTLGERSGRYTFTHEHHEAARYAGELLLYFLRENGIEVRGAVRSGYVQAQDRLVLSYRSMFTLEQAIQKMLEFSNNFMANQILIATGAAKYSPPGTLEKAVRAASEFTHKEQNLSQIKIVEGSGISRGNRLSAMDMLAILKHFTPYRHLLKREGDLLYKSGSLRGIRTRAGYIEKEAHGPCPFVVFLNRSNVKFNSLMHCLESLLDMSTNR